MERFEIEIITKKNRNGFDDTIKIEAEYIGGKLLDVISPISSNLRTILNTCKENICNNATMYTSRSGRIYNPWYMHMFWHASLFSKIDEMFTFDKNHNFPFSNKHLLSKLEDSLYRTCNDYRAWCNKKVLLDIKKEIENAVRDYSFDFSKREDKTITIPLVIRPTKKVKSIYTTIEI